METPEKEAYRRLETLADNRSAAVEIAQAARRELVLFSRDLEPGLYDREDFIGVVQALATRSRMSRIRIVGIDPGPSIRAGHRLVGLAQRFSSYIEVRRAARDHAEMAETFLVADEAGVLYRPISSRFEGYAGVHQPMEARQHLKTFESIWNLAEPDSEFRRLGI